MVRAGELGGVLDTVLISLSVFMEKSERIKNKVVSAMVYNFYPILTIVMVFLVMIAVLALSMLPTEK